MKRIIPFFMLAFASMFIYSCDNSDDVVEVPANDIVLQMRDVTGTFTANNGFKISQGLAIANTDAILVYRNTNSNTSNGAVWQLIPKTYYLDDVNNLPVGRELDYNFDFTSQDVQIRTEANFNQSSQITTGEIAQYLTNQTFRIIILPADPNKNSTLNYNDYNAVIKYYNIDESKVIKTTVN
ncbi:hypothetical protein N0B16_06630 [Chryseobacterium sp. GMJ5]|uniref:Uncharacterized protein n=1 Tax=Chryseobacterium gilvum TaxID=2976534 RepID=A0ABT2VWV2_9FLAO|nr:hypothetical protein [Chryseobacterium gilvum]MCU7614108.1 hypothetical protein [Chryseobacterium gilvum]